MQSVHGYLPPIVSRRGDALSHDIRFNVLLNLTARLPKELNGLPLTGRFGVLHNYCQHGVAIPKRSLVLIHVRLAMYLRLLHSNGLVGHQAALLRLSKLVPSLLPLLLSGTCLQHGPRVVDTLRAHPMTEHLVWLLRLLLFI